MSYNIQKIRQLLDDGFSDDDISSICQSNFYAVYNNFAPGQTKEQHIRMLIDFAHRQMRINELLDICRERNTPQYARYQPYTTDATVKTDAEKHRTRNKIILLSTAAVLVVAAVVWFGLQYSAEKKPDTAANRDTTNQTLPRDSHTNPIAKPDSVPAGRSMPTDNKLTIEVGTNKGKKPVFKAKDEVKITFKVNKPVFVRVLYRMADNSVILLLDNYKVEADKINQTIPVPLTFICSEPFGSEKLVVYAQTIRFEPLSTQPYGQYTLVTDDWEKALTLTEKGLGIKKELAKNEILVITEAE